MRLIVILSWVLFVAGTSQAVEPSESIRACFTRAWKTRIRALFAGERSASAISPELQKLASFSGQPLPRWKGRVHEVKIENGRGTLKIGGLDSSQKEFVRQIFATIREGSLDEIDAGAIAGPKMLSLMDRFKKAAVDAGTSLRLRGYFNPEKIREEAQEEIFVSPRQNPDSAAYWSFEDTTYFFYVLRELRVIGNDGYFQFEIWRRIHDVPTVDLEIDVTDGQVTRMETR